MLVLLVHKFKHHTILEVMKVIKMAQHNDNKRHNEIKKFSKHLNIGTASNVSGG